MSEILTERLQTARRKRLVELRKSLGLTQKEFAAEIGKSLRQVQYYESGGVNVPTHVERIVDLLESRRATVDVLIDAAKAVVRAK